MNKLKFSIVVLNLLTYSYADTTITLSQTQLNLVESASLKKIDAAKALMPSINTTLKPNESNLNSRENINLIAISQAKGKTAPINLEYESGHKYFIFSDEMKQQAIQTAEKYKKASPVDAAKTIAYYNEMTKNTKAQIGDNRLLIFISYSMPKAKVEQLVKEGAPIGAVFVFRGMINNSLKQTQKTFTELKQNYKVGAMINPKLFQVMKVEQVPTFALYIDDGQDLLSKACNTQPIYSKLEGDVSIRYALEQLKRSNEDGIGQLANNYLDLIDSNSYYNKRSKN